MLVKLLLLSAVLVGGYFLAKKFLGSKSVEAAKPEVKAEKSKKPSDKN